MCIGALLEALADLEKRQNDAFVLSRYPHAPREVRESAREEVLRLQVIIDRNKRRLSKEYKKERGA